MAKDSAKYTECKARLDLSEAQRIAAQAWVSASFRGMVPKQLLLSFPDSQWVAHVINASAPHGGIVVITTLESAYVHECVMVDDLASSWLHSADQYMRDNARSLLKFRSQLVEAAKEA